MRNPKMKLGECHIDDFQTKTEIKSKRPKLEPGSRFHRAPHEKFLPLIEFNKTIKDYPKCSFKYRSDMYCAVFYSLTYQYKKK